MPRGGHVFLSSIIASSQHFPWLLLSKRYLYNIYWIPELIGWGSSLPFSNQFPWMSLNDLQCIYLNCWCSPGKIFQWLSITVHINYHLSQIFRQHSYIHFKKIRAGIHKTVLDKFLLCVDM